MLHTANRTTVDSFGFRRLAACPGLPRACLQGLGGVEPRSLHSRSILPSSGMLEDPG